MSDQKMPPLPATIDELFAREAAAAEKYRPLVERLGQGEFLGLVKATQLELARRSAWAKRVAGISAPGDRIGNR